MEFFIPFMLAIAAILITPLLLKRIHIPKAVSVLLAGILLGPYGIDAIGYITGLTGGTTGDIYFMFETMGLLGAIFLMSLAGMEMSPKLIKKQWKSITVFALLSTLLPASTGFLIAYRMGLDIVSSIFLASLFASHSVALVFATLKHFKMLHTKIGIILLESTLVTDILALIMLSVSIQMKAYEGKTFSDNPMYILNHFHVNLNFNGLLVFAILSVLLFIVFSIAITRWISRYFSRWVRSEGSTMVTAVMFLILVVSFIGEIMGIHIIIGAFIAGLAIADSTWIKEDDRSLHKKLDTIGYGIFIPFFFFNLGLNTNIRIIGEGANILLLVVILGALLIATKLLSGWLALRLIGFQADESFVGAWMTIPQLSATLVAAQVGFIEGIIPHDLFTSIIIISLITTLMRPLGSKLLLHMTKVEFKKAEPEIRDLIYTINAPELDKESTEPIYELVPEDSSITEPNIDDIEEYVEKEETIAENLFEEETLE